MSSTVNVSGQNQLLSLLAPDERGRIIQRCDKLRLEQRAVVYEAGSRIEDIYFPLSGMVSLVLSSEQGQTIEVGTIGREGMLGTPLILGAEKSRLETVVQVAGEFLRMRRQDLEPELNGNGVLRSLAHRFAQALTNQIGQSVLCNRIHSVEERLCRWFLMTHDRAGSREISITQDFVAQMLGVRRPTVTAAVGKLQKAGLVYYARGRLGIIDRKGLEAGACECYRIVQRETVRLLRL